MGLLDGILGGLGGSTSGQGQMGQNPLEGILNSLGSGGSSGSSRNAALLTAALSMLQQNGGLSSVLEMFGRNGMADQAASWVGTGKNAAISASQFQQVFGGSSVSQLASQLGMSEGQASSTMAQLLPELINQLTPQGEVPANHSDLLTEGLSMLGRFTSSSR
jgi:uncharacterized protein YidB (DUF937 family)